MKAAHSLCTATVSTIDIKEELRPLKETDCMEQTASGEADRSSAGQIWLTWIEYGEPFR